MTLMEPVVVTKDDDGVRLNRWFKKYYPLLNHSNLEKLFRTGQIRLNGRRVKSNARLSTGQVIRIPPIVSKSSSSDSTHGTINPRTEEIEEIKTNILHMDHHILAINKPAGLAVQGGSKLKTHLDAMLDELSFELKEKPRLVHRLDKDTSGVLILARSRKSAQFLAEAFNSNLTRKVYWAIVKGVPKPRVGELNFSLSKSSKGAREKVAVDNSGKFSITRYHVVDHAGRKAAWLSLEPLTGRTHQLRVHCKELGTPILGDGKYGGSAAFLQESPNYARRLQLHARGIRIPKPGGGLLEVTAPLPKHMSLTWQLLGFEEALDGQIFS